MPLPFHPPAGQILICDFEGLKEPEIVKRRPVVVVSPRRRRGQVICTVVPISTTPPIPELPHHFQLQIEPALPNPYSATNVWVKCDMIYTVAAHRLCLPWYRDAGGERRYVNQYVSDDDLQVIQRCLLSSLGFSELARYL